MLLESVVMSNFSFLILVTSEFLHSFLINLAHFWFHWFHLLFWAFISLTSTLIIISFLLLTLDLICSSLASYDRKWGHRLEIFIFAIAVYHYKFPPKILLYRHPPTLMLLFSFSFKYFLISLFFTHVLKCFISFLYICILNSY